MTHATHSNVAMTDIGSVLGSLEDLRAGLPAAQQAVIDELLRAARVKETSPPQYNPYLPGVHADPHPHYRRLQSENAVHYSQSIGAWILSRYRDVNAALRDPRLSSRVTYDTVMASVPADEHHVIHTVSGFVSSGLNQLEGDEHVRLRRIMARALSPEALVQLRPRIERAVDELIDAVVATGQMDLVEDFARPLPAVVAAVLLGIPEEDRDTVIGWVEAIMNTFAEGFSGSDAMVRGEAAVPALLSYLQGLTRQRLVQPGDDVISTMLAGGEASEKEVVHLAAHFPIGMHENIRHAISLGMLSLLLAPDQLARVQIDSALVPFAVEEMLRYDGTVPYLTRMAAEDIEIGGASIAKGQRVVLLLAASNRDPEKFIAADQFDAGRRPNQHIAFGAGQHACTGAALTRTVCAIAFGALLTRLSELRLADPGPSWCEELNVRGLQSLPVRFTTRTGLAGGRPLRADATAIAEGATP